MAKEIRPRFTFATVCIAFAFVFLGASKPQFQSSDNPKSKRISHGDRHWGLRPKRADLDTQAPGVIIGLRQLAHLPAVQTMASQLGIDVQLVLRTLPVVYLAAPESLDLTWLIERLNDFGIEPAFVERNLTRRRTLVPSDPELTKQWGLRNSGATLNVPGVGNVSAKSGADLNLEAAWDITTGSADIVVAIVDDSLDAGHPDLKDLIWLNPGELTGTAAPRADILDEPCPSWTRPWPDINGDGVFNIQDFACDSRVNIADSASPKSDGFLDPTDLIANPAFANGVDDDGNGIVDDLYGVRFEAGVGTNDPATRPDSDDGHGTAVAGCVGAMSDNGIGIAGPSWRVRLMPIAFDLGLASELAAFQYAIDMGAKIVNASWGGSEETLSEYAGVQALAEAGILLVAAAGNWDTSNDWYVYYPSGIDLPNVVAVAASAPGGTMTDWTQFGQTRVDFAAPGEFAMTTMPLLNADFYGAAGEDELYDFISGTSFSSPYIAGVAALVAAAHPAASPLELRARLVASTRPLDGSHGYSSTDGMPDAAAALTMAAAPVMIVSEMRFLDGNDDEFDRGEIGQLELRLENLWESANDVTAVLSTDDAAIVVISDMATYDAIDNGESAWPISGFTLQIAADIPDYYVAQVTATIYADAVSASRRLRLEIAALQNLTLLSETISRHPQDDVHVYHIDVSAGAIDLRVRTFADTDIDLIVWTGGRAITSGVESYFSESGSGNETILVPNPTAGVWYAHVFNYDLVPNTPYQVDARIRFSTATPPNDTGSTHVSRDQPETDIEPPPPDDESPPEPEPIVASLQPRAGGGLFGCSAGGSAGGRAAWQPLFWEFAILALLLRRRSKIRLNGSA